MGRRLVRMNLQSYKRIYIASPYSHVDPAVREKRFKDVTEIAAHLFVRYDCVFLLPITQGHLLAQLGEIESDFERWKTQSLGMLSVCDEMWVIMLNGWKKSKGVGEEIKFAKENKIKLRYINPSSYIASS